MNSILGKDRSELPYVLSIEAIGQILGISRTTAYDHARRDLLPVPVIKSGRRMMVSTTAILKVLNQEKGVA